MKPTAPGSSFSYILLAIYFSFAFLFRSIKPKLQKYLVAIYFIWRSIYQYLQLSHVRLPISSAVARKGLTTPLTGRVPYLLFVCRCCLRSAWCSYWFDNLDLITEGNILPLLCCIIPSSLGKYRCSFKTHQKEFLAPLAGRHHQHLPGS